MLPRYFTPRLLAGGTTASQSFAAASWTLALRLSAGGTASANRDPRIFALFLLFKRLIEIRIYGFSITFRYIISWFWIFRLELDLLWIKSIQIDLIHNKSISNR